MKNSQSSRNAIKEWEHKGLQCIYLKKRLIFITTSASYSDKISSAVRMTGKTWNEHITKRGHPKY